MFAEVFIFILGLIFGSFANSAIFRLDSSESLFSGRSKCLSCQKKLNWLELIPVISFIIQKGRCRKCKVKLSYQYPLVEFGAGLLFLSVWLNLWTSDIHNLVLGISFWYLLFIASIYDLKHQILPDIFIYSGAVIAMLANYNHPASMLSGFFAFLFFGFIWFFSKGKAIGFGDAKMAGGLGLFLGFPKIISGLVFSFWIGAFYGLVLIILKKANLKTAIPFGPYLFLGSFISWLYDVNIFFKF